MITFRAADDAEVGGALPATAGATTCPGGERCCSFVGSGFGGLAFGERGKLSPSSISWPAISDNHIVTLLSRTSHEEKFSENGNSGSGEGAILEYDQVEELHLVALGSEEP